MDPSPNDDPGTVSLRIRDIRVSDNGTYTCYFKSVSYYHSATVQLQVTALGSALHLHLKDYEEGGIQVLCHSAGWFPTPLLQWKKLGHEQEPYASKVQITEDGDGLFGVEGALILKESDPVSWVCHVSSGLKNQEREARFSVADVIFPHHSPMLLILPLFLVALVLLTLVCLILLRRQLRENGRLLLVKENLLAENVKLKKERDAMVSDQEARLENMRQFATDLTLDRASANPYLLVSEDGRAVSRSDTRLAVDDGPERFDPRANVLGMPTFTSGCHFWEVETGSKRDWDVGVCLDSVARKDMVTLGPEAGFWVLWARNGSQLAAITTPKTALSSDAWPRRVGVFLNCEAGTVSFYNINTHQLIYSFTEPSGFPGPLRAFFYPGPRPEGQESVPLKILEPGRWG